MSTCWMTCPCDECNYAECHYAECLYAECHYAECHYAECHYAECRYAECRGANPRHYWPVNIMLVWPEVQSENRPFQKLKKRMKL